MATLATVSEWLRRPEWAYYRAFVREARDQAMAKLMVCDPGDAVATARLQQEVNTLSMVVGDHPVFQPIAEAMKESLRALEQDTVTEPEEAEIA